jgi:hypothetical protein
VVNGPIQWGDRTWAAVILFDKAGDETKQEQEHAVPHQPTPGVLDQRPLLRADRHTIVDFRWDRFHLTSPLTDREGVAANVHRLLPRARVCSAGIERLELSEPFPDAVQLANSRLTRLRSPSTAKVAAP